MSTDNKGSSGAEQTPGGSSEETTQTTQTVAYESHQKLLREKKATAEKLAAAEKRLADLDAAAKAREEEELRQKGEVEKILKLREEELSSERSKRAEIEQRLEGGMKLSAVLEALPGHVDGSYFPLMDLSQVVIDPTTGQPDKASVAKYAKEFATKYAAVIQKPTAARLPNEAASGRAEPINEETWKAMSLKEKRANMKAFVEQLKKQ